MPKQNILFIIKTYHSILKQGQILEKVHKKLEFKQSK